MAKNQPKKKAYVPLPKDQRKTRRGWADGWRSEWLSQYVSAYSAALRKPAGQRQQAEDALLEEVYRQYFVKVHWTIADTDEPPLPVNEWRGDVVMPVDELTDDEMIEKRGIVEARKAAIRRWIRYRALRLGRSRRRIAGDLQSDPYGVLLAQLSGVQKPGKARQAFQEWQVNNRVEIRAEVKRRWNTAVRLGEQTGKLQVDFRQAVAMDMFKSLSEEEQEQWGTTVAKTAEAAKERYNAVVNGAPTTDPVVRAECIDGLANFMQPIAEMVGAVTGLQLVIHAVGPMPQYGGEISVITVSSGKNLETPAVPVTKWQPQRYQNYKKYLERYARTCYTQTELDAAKLPNAAVGSRTALPSEMDIDLADIGREITRLAMDEADEEDEDEDEEQEEDDDDEEGEEIATAETKRRQKGQAEGTRAKKRKTTAQHAQETPRATNAHARPQARQRKKNGKSAEARMEGDPVPDSNDPASNDGNPAANASGDVPMDTDASRATSPLPARRSGRLSAKESAPPRNINEEEQQEEEEEENRMVIPDKAIPKVFDDPDAEERRADVQEGLLDVKPWFAAPYQALEAAQDTLGPIYRKLLDHLVLLEAAEEWQGKGDLPANGRPEKLTAWVVAGRLTRKKEMPPPLTAGEMPAFKRVFKRWYDSMQPEWRQKENGKGGGWKRGRMKHSNKDWGLIDGRGVNAWLGIVVCLYWWGEVAINSGQAEYDDWEAAVIDASWVMEALLAA